MRNVATVVGGEWSIFVGDVDCRWRTSPQSRSQRCNRLDQRQQPTSTSGRTMLPLSATIVLLKLQISSPASFSTFNQSVYYAQDSTVEYSKQNEYDDTSAANFQWIIIFLQVLASFLGSFRSLFLQRFLFVSRVIHFLLLPFVIFGPGTDLMPLLILGRPLKKHKAWDRGEVWQDCSSSKYASNGSVRFLIWRQNFTMAAMTSFHPKNDAIAAIWWVHTQHLPGVYAASASFWYIVDMCTPKILEQLN